MRAASVSPSPKKVLFAEDDKEVRESMEQLLRTIGHIELIVAVDGTDAISKLTSDLALVLVDYRMPGATGNEVLRAAVDKCPRAKRVILSAFAKRDMETTWAHEVLQKPDGALEAERLIHELG